MVGVGIKLALVGGFGRDSNGNASAVGVGLMAAKSVDRRVAGMKSSKHVVEGAVLHHEDNDVPEVLYAWQSSVRHGKSSIQV